MEKVYCGRRRERRAGPAEVWVNGKALSPAASQKVRNHSPDGFNWGYGGSGPAQLALALLLDALRQRSAAVRWYQQFKREVVALLPAEWVMLKSEVELWYQNVRADDQITEEQVDAEIAKIQTDGAAGQGPSDNGQPAG